MFQRREWRLPGPSRKAGDTGEPLSSARVCLLLLWGIEGHLARTDLCGHFCLLCWQINPRTEAGLRQSLLLQDLTRTLPGHKIQHPTPSAAVFMNPHFGKAW